MYDVTKSGTRIDRTGGVISVRWPAVTRAVPWAAPDGLAGYWWRTRRPRANLLLQHGFAEHSGRYVASANRLIPHLNALGVDVFAFDLAGHGRSPGRRGDADIRRMVAAHIEARRKLSGMTLPLFLFGHSLGGLVTAASVAKSPGGVRGVILSAPALPAQPRWLDRVKLWLTVRLAPMTGISPPGDLAGLTRIEEEVRAIENDPLVGRVALSARVASTALAATRLVENGISEWTCPTLALHGDADPYTDMQGARG